MKHDPLSATPAQLQREERRAAPRPSVAPLNVAMAGQRPLARAARVLVLITADFGALFLAGAAAYVFWALPERGQTSTMYLELSPLLSLFVFGYALFGLYPGFGLGPVEILRRTSYVTAFGFLVLAAFSFALKLPHLYSRATFFIALVLSLVLVPLVRALVWHLVGRTNWWREPVVIIGSGERAVRALQDLTDSVQGGYRPVVLLVLDAAIAHAQDFARRGIHTALLETDGIHDRGVVDRLQRSFRRVVLLRDFDGLAVEGVRVRNLGRFVGIEYTNNLTRPGNRLVKRALDVMFAGLALLVTLPFILVAVTLVLIVDGAPVLYTQTRTGLLGRRLRVPKIRTMKRGADDQLEKDLTANPTLRAEWNTHLKLKNDPRLLPGIGRVLRRFSIDELPQLWTVLQGHMSLVGPRPFPDYHMSQFSEEFVDLRRRVRPGLTGLWQISIRSGGTISEQESYDSYYIRNWSVWLDLYILSRTISAVFSGRGAY